MSEPRHRCPTCHSSERLLEEVELTGFGWRSIDEWGQLAGTGYDVEWQDAYPLGRVCCACGWAGTRDELVVLGTDGRPLVPVHPRQLRFEVAA